jgi:FlaA1/EpsC-like NDP-sugar epimerase
MESTEKPPSKPKITLAFLGYLAAFVLTLCGLFLNNVTFATNDSTAIVIQALVASIVASILFLICWRHMPTPGRVVSVALLLANIWTILDAGFRRLPTCLGWT